MCYFKDSHHEQRSSPLGLMVPSSWPLWSATSYCEGSLSPSVHSGPPHLSKGKSEIWLSVIREH